MPKEVHLTVSGPRLLPNPAVAPEFLLQGAPVDLPNPILFLSHAHDCYIKHGPKDGSGFAAGSFFFRVAQ